MVARFQEFVKEFVVRAEYILEDHKDDLDADLYDVLDELDQLESLASRWDTPMAEIEIAEIAEQIRELIRRSTLLPTDRRKAFADCSH